MCVMQWYNNSNDVLYLRPGELFKKLYTIKAMDICANVTIHNVTIITNNIQVSFDFKAGLILHFWKEIPSVNVRNFA